jgi:hypothetical protein
VAAGVSAAGAAASLVAEAGDGFSNPPDHSGRIGVAAGDEAAAGAVALPVAGAVVLSWAIPVKVPERSPTSVNMRTFDFMYLDQF